MEDFKLKLEAPWPEVKETLKEANLELTDEDLDYVPGKEKDLLERLSKKMGKDIPAVKAWIESASFTKGIASQIETCKSFSSDFQMAHYFCV